ncbi:septum formation initiator family protein [Bacteroidota bacterium]|nr:septum formation initiator family protein [Bacteroidota bacterium]
MGLRKLKLKNPYLVAYIAIGVFFLLWMVFLDTHSLLVHQELNKEIENLKKRKEFLESQIEKDNRLISNLNNIDSLEKFAREKYKHKKNNETILIVE